MENGLLGKVIVITGGAGGMAQRPARLFARPVHALPWSIRAKRPSGHNHRDAEPRAQR